MTKQSKPLCVDNLRHAEYYGMQEIFDDLYARSKIGEEFVNLTDLILSRENILLAYRNIKNNAGSSTPGTDKTTIEDIGKLTPDEVVNNVRYIVQGSVHGYRPKPVRRKDIPKPNGKTRPLGIPCMWDRLIQQCIKQVMEPICEAKFSDNSYGFRPNRSVENAISATFYKLQRANMSWVIEFDIKGFFDNVDHSKLIKQIWAMGIHDKHLIYIIRKILKAPIKMPDGTVIFPNKGTPQGGIISPLLANIVLNELDHWIDSQWQKNPITKNYSIGTSRNGTPVYSSGYRAMRGTKLKEMYIVRYADDFRIFCSNKEDAEKTKIAVTKWLSKRLNLEISEEKTKIVNVKSKWMEFLGFKIRLRKKGKKYVVRSHMSDKAKEKATKTLIEQAKNIVKPRDGKSVKQEIQLYNYQVMGIQNYYQIATEITKDLGLISRRIKTILKNRLKETKKGRLKRKGRQLSEFEQERYGGSRQLRYESETKEPIYPIGYIQSKNPMNKRHDINSYSAEGRKGLHSNLQINRKLMLQIMMMPNQDRSTEYADNRISLFSAQKGKCAVTGKDFETTKEIHCHHKIPRNKGGTDKYDNLVLVLNEIHILIHATNTETIDKYLKLYALNKEQLKKLNEFRKTAGLKPLTTM